MMSTIYEPKGRALEYAKRALNLYTGCPHGCVYCFNRCMPWVDRDKYKAAVSRTNLAEALELCCSKLRDKGEIETLPQVHLCFSCDPYPIGIDSTTTRDVLLVLEKYKVPKVTILTKGGMQAARDFDILRRNDWSFGSTIGLHSESLRQLYEPGAARFGDRLNAIMEAKRHGIRTWASIEPVMLADEAVECIDWTRGFIDLFKLGRTNHISSFADDFPEWVEPNWRDYLDRAVKLLEGRRYYIKKDLAISAGYPTWGRHGY